MKEYPIHIIDWLIVIIYLITILLVGVFAGRYSKEAKEYIYDKKNYTTPIITATVVATLIGGGHTIGSAAQIYKDGVLYLLVLSIGGVITYYLSARIIAPKIAKLSELGSLGGIMQYFYGTEARFITGIIGFVQGFGLVGGQVLAMGYLLEALLQIPVLQGVLISGGIVIAYSAFGGAKAVTATDVLQFTILLIVIPTISSICVSKVGGLFQLITNIPAEKLSLNPKDSLLFLGLFIWVIIPSLNPFFLNRCLLTNKPAKLQKALYTASMLEIPLSLMIAGISFSSLILYPNLEPNQVLSNAISQMLPPVVKGLAIAGMLAVIMSTADTILHNTSIMVVDDIMGPLYKTSLSHKQKMLLMSFLTSLIGVFAILVALSLKGIMSLIIFFGSLYMPVVTIPLLFAILGFKSNKMGFLVSSLLGLSTFLSLNFSIDSQYKYMAFLISILVSLIGFLVVYFSQNQEAISKSWFHWRNDKANASDVQLKEYIITKTKVILYSLWDIKSFSQRRVEHYGAEYLLFAIFGCINYIVPYFMFPYSEAQHYPVIISLRVFAGILCLLLLMKDYWPYSLHKYLPVYWHLVLLVYLPLSTTTIFLIEQGKLQWLLNMALSVFMLAVLVDWLSFIVIHACGTILGYFLYRAISYNHDLNLSGESIFLVIYLNIFTSIIGLLFTRKKGITEREKLESYKVLGGAIAHELRTPILKIELSGNNLNMPNAEVEKIKNNILQAVRQSTVLINSLLMNLRANSKFSLNSFVTINECIDEAMNSYPFTETERSTIKIEIDKNFSFMGNKEYIVQVLLNLLKNSLYYVAIREQPIIMISTVQKAQTNCLIFYDNGQGMDSEVVNRVFQPFYSNRPSGTGIGLTFAKMVMENHKGSISCESKEGEYTRFILTFP